MPLFLPANFPITQTPHNRKSQKNEAHGPSTRNDDKKKKSSKRHRKLGFKDLALFAFPGTERERSSLSNPNPNPSPNPNSSSHSLPWIII
jgi:hypothetical protein